ncbi:hypothetical protein [Limibacterium fermenti]|jgi:hypothetical protein|uniref:hypothetical protein n=1 Tax=Limibacterium fermenti TaxID=3229863 RepID=UPI0026A31FA3
MRRVKYPLFLIIGIAFFACFYIRDPKYLKEIAEATIIGILAVAVIPEIRRYYDIRRSIKEGIKTIREGQAFVLDEMQISIAKDSEKENALTVRNLSQWIYTIHTYDSAEQMRLLVKDFESLQKYRAWRNFISGLAIQINLYSDETFEEEIIESTIRTYRFQ